MGLSDQERYSKIIYSIKEIVSLSENLKNDFNDYDKIKNLVGDLWYSFLGNNSVYFWLTGSSFDSDTISQETLVGAVFCSHAPPSLDSCRAKREDEFIDYWGVVEDLTDFYSLLEQAKSAVAKIFMHTEHIGYALKRYDDDFFKKYENLNKVLCKIQGECFSVFSEDKDFAHAWMISKLVDKAFTCEEHDLVNQWWMKHSIHHNMHIRKEFSFEEVFHLFRKFQLSKDLSLMDRIHITLYLSGRRYNYDFQHKEFLDMIEYHNNICNDEKVDVNKVKEWLQECLEEAEEKAEAEKELNRSCDFTFNSFYDGELDNWRYGKEEDRNEDNEEDKNDELISKNETGVQNDSQN